MSENKTTTTYTDNLQDVDWDRISREKIEWDTRHDISDDQRIIDWAHGRREDKD